MPRVYDRIKIGKTVWLFGKGPSLDTFDYSTCGNYRVCVNETVLTVPEPYLFVGSDYNVQDRVISSPVMKNVIACRKEQHVQYEYPKMYLWRYGREVQRIAGTAETAIQLCHYFGAKRFYMVGFDSIDHISGYSRSISRIGAEGQTDDNYSRINHSLLETIQRLGVKVFWEHRKALTCLNTEKQ